MATTDTPLTIFVPDCVPLCNKGEEAIIRGIEDMLGAGHPCVEVAVFDNVKETTRLGNITAFPDEWVYPMYSRKHGLFGSRVRWAWDLGKRMAGMSGTMGRIATSKDPLHREMVEVFRRADYVPVGHDGVFDLWSCALIHVARKRGKRTGILGAGVVGLGSRLFQYLYRKAVEESDFCTLRERNAYEYMKSIGCEPTKMRLEPDPAFAMQPAPAEQVRAFLDGQEWYARARNRAKILVAVTVAHKEIILQRPFAEAAGPAEQGRLHTNYLAEVLDRVLAERDVFLVFLPHSIEPGPRNDLRAAQDVAAAMKSPPESRHVMTDDLRARAFKGIIADSDFLIGQRAHSLIGAASVTTPYVALTATNDLRTHDILGEMCGCEKQMVDMDLHTPEEAARKIVGALDERDGIHAHLQEKMVELNARLRGVAAWVSGASGPPADDGEQR